MVALTERVAPEVGTIAEWRRAAEILGPRAMARREPIL
jgi:hypothetical protein